LFIFEDAEKEDKVEGKARGAEFLKKKLLLYSLSAFSSCLICTDSRQFMILDPGSG